MTLGAITRLRLVHGSQRRRLRAPTPPVYVALGSPLNTSTTVMLIHFQRHAERQLCEDLATHSRRRRRRHLRTSAIVMRVRLPRVALNADAYERLRCQLTSASPNASAHVALRRSSRFLREATRCCTRRSVRPRSVAPRTLSGDSYRAWARHDDVAPAGPRPAIAIAVSAELGVDSLALRLSFTRAVSAI